MCGSYYQGRGQHTHAFTHALETGHHMFMKLEDGRVYCLPEGYEVEDRSLDPIRYVLNPTFPPEKVLPLLELLWPQLLALTMGCRGWRRDLFACPDNRPHCSNLQYAADECGGTHLILCV